MALNQLAFSRDLSERSSLTLCSRGDEKLVFESSEAVSVVRINAVATKHAAFHREG